MQPAERRDSYKISSVRSLEKNPLCTPRRNWKEDFREISCQYMKLNGLRRDSVTTATNTLFP